MTRKELKKRIEKYEETEAYTDDSYNAMLEVAQEMYEALELYEKKFEMTAEDGTEHYGDARDMAELIHWNYSEVEWIGFMWMAERNHGTYEINPYGNDVVTIKW